MDREMYPIILEEIIQSLKISKDDLEADVHNITEYWETCLDKAGISNRDTAILILTTGVSCYLKGRGINFENSQATSDNSGLLLTLVTLIPLYAWTRPADDYPKIHSLIQLNKDTRRNPARKKDMLSQLEDILQDKWPE
jgi:hypothetical protein